MEYRGARHCPCLHGPYILTEVSDKHSDRSTAKVAEGKKIYSVGEIMDGCKEQVVFEVRLGG